MSFYYPPLDAATLRSLEVVRQLASDHPGYFLESPYSGEVEDMIKQWFFPAKPQQPTVEAPAPNLFEGNRWEALSRESEQLYSDLKQAKWGAAETSEQLSYFRTATSLLDKIVGLQERALGLKAVHEFHHTVMQIMEEVLSPTQRTEVMEKLKSAIGE